MTHLFGRRYIFVLSLPKLYPNRLRVQVLNILLKVDRNIVESYFTQISASNFAAVLQDPSGDLTKALEVIEVLSGDDGEVYAQQVVHMLSSVSDNPHRRNHVYEGAIEEILSYIKNCKTSFVFRWHTQG